ncbi:MAG: HEAT repeat protein [Myxococcota bacterium]|jgi:HEAT repeat protein
MNRTCKLDPVSISTNHRQIVFGALLSICLAVAPTALAVEASDVSATVTCKVLDAAKCPAFKTIIDAGEASGPILLEALTSPNQAIRGRAARIISRTEVGSAKQKTRKLLELLKAAPPVAETKKNESTRPEIVEALGRIGHVDALDTLVALTTPKSSGPRERMYVVAALGSFKGQAAAANALRNALNDPMQRIQMSAATSLGLALDPKADNSTSVDALVNRALAEITASYVREACARSLGKLNDRRAIGALSILMANQNASVKRAASVALGRLGASSAVPLLVGQLGNPDVNKAAVKALGLLGTADAIEALATALTKKSFTKEGRLLALWTLGEKKATAAVNGIGRLLTDKDAEVARAAVEALGSIKSTDAVTKLVPLLEHENKEVARSTLWALREITGEKYGADKDAWRRWRPQAPTTP